MSGASRGGPALALRAILAGGALAGTLDILAAFTVWALRGVPPIRILQGIASGLCGAAAFKGGLPMAALGLGLHFFIASSASAAYYVASRRLPLLLRWPLPFGALYGIVVYVVMNFVVLPLSAVRHRPFDPHMAAIMVPIHMACVGIPIALAVRRANAGAGPATS